MAQITEIELNGTSYELADMTARNYAYTKAETDAAYVAKSGDTMTGDLIVPKVNIYGNNGSNDYSIKFVSGANNNRWYVYAETNNTVADHARWAFNNDGNIYIDKKIDGNYPGGVTNLATYNAQTSRTANTILAAPNGSNGAATFRALVTDDIPSLPTSKITSGTFGVARGGTGASTLASGEALIGNGTSAVNTRAITNNTSKGNLGWSSASTNGTNLITLNTLAYWNGSYNSTTSNITTLGTITSGTWNGTAIGSSYVDNLPASKITSGTFDTARIPTLSATKISGGALSVASVSATGAITTSGNIACSDYIRFSENNDTLRSYDGSIYLGTFNGANNGEIQWRFLKSSGQLNFRTYESGEWGSWQAMYWGASTSRTANTVLAAPNGSNGAGSFRSLVAADIPNLNASKITAGTLPLTRGGTGVTSVAENTKATDYITAASGVTISDFKLTKWGPIVCVFFKANPGSAKTSAWTVGTVVSGFRPNNNVTSRPYYTSCECAQLTTGGSLTMTAATANAIPVSFTYLLV